MHTPLEIVEEWAGHVRLDTVNADKVWAAAYASSGHYLAVWGRRGTHYQGQTLALGTTTAAAGRFRAKRAEKLGRGYVVIPFGHAQFGAIPSFASATLAGPSAGGPRITLDGVLAELASLPERLLRAGPRLPEALFAFAQTRLKAELLLDAGRLTDAERLTCLAALASARAAAEHVLTT